ncbi:MAG: B12-binding domain-containing protein [Blautia caecimuris]
MAGIQEVYALVEKGKAKVIANAVQEALDAGCDPTEILNDGMIKAMDAVGEKFKNGEIFVPGNAGSCKSHEKKVLRF